MRDREHKVKKWIVSGRAIFAEPEKKYEAM